MPFGWRRVRVAALAIATLSATCASASAAVITIGPDGVTSPVFSYAAATRERVYIPQPGIDQDGDGVADRIAVEIIRPAESGPGMQVPAIIDPSPYYTTVCRGNEG